jgi:hypothetical protein
MGCGKSRTENETELWTITGRYCEDINGSSILLSDEQGAICISPAAENEGKDLFADFENGDRIEISVDGIAETYPAQASVYDCRLLEKGSVEDLDADEFQTLIELGWEFSFSITSADSLTMDELIAMQEAADWVTAVAQSSIADWNKYENLMEYMGEGDDSLTGLYHGALSYGEKTYDFQVYYWPEDTAGQYGKSAGSIDMILLMDPDTDDGIALYRSDWDEDQNKAQDLRGFLAKVYDITASITFEMPESDKISSEISQGEYRVDQFLSPFAGSLFLSDDYSEPAHGEYIEEGWYSLGGIEEWQEPDEEMVSFRNGKLTDVNILGNHMGYEKVESIQTDEFTCLLYEYEFDLYTASDAVGISEDTPLTSNYWVAFLNAGEGQPVYMLFLNCNYFTKDAALNCARSVR